MVHYEGIFFDKKTEEYIHSLESKQLDVINDILHVTFVYNPSKDKIYNDLVGKYFDVYLISYANDGNNSGFEVELPDYLMKYYHNYDEVNNVLKEPHITASISKLSNANNTKNLKFNKFENKIKITGRFGLWIKEEDNEYLSFEKYN